MKLIFSGLLFLVFSCSFAQQSEVPDFEAVDSLYREDQFYLSFTYNILNQRNANLKQNKFSSGLGIGFLRDFPLNKQRNVSIAAGAGYSFNNYNFNLIAAETASGVTYSLIDADNGYDRNRLMLHFIDVPLEFRWRTSTFDSHKFWRVYTGVKLSYLFSDTSTYSEPAGKSVVKNNPDLEKFRYGLYVAAGYNTWNATIYYGLNPLYKKGTLYGEAINMTTLNIGLMFYIL